MAKIDLDRCRRGMRQIRLTGTPTTGARKALIEDVIMAIQRDPFVALRSEYYGIKNYAGFGDQREDHPYNVGPRHGHIVFSIGRSEWARVAGHALDADAIYFLECARDFVELLYGGIGGSPKTPAPLNLQQAIDLGDCLKRDYHAVMEALSGVDAESHV